MVVGNASQCYRGTENPARGGIQSSIQTSTAATKARSHLQHAALPLAAAARDALRFLAETVFCRETQYPRPGCRPLERKAATRKYARPRVQGADTARAAGPLAPARRRRRPKSARAVASNQATKAARGAWLGGRSGCARPPPSKIHNAEVMAARLSQVPSVGPLRPASRQLPRARARHQGTAPPRQARRRRRGLTPPTPATARPPHPLRARRAAVTSRCTARTAAAARRPRARRGTA